MSIQIRIGPMQVRESYRRLETELAEGRPAAGVTVVRTRGATPREAGAKMVITQEGSWGTIGGGCGEADVMEAALEMLASGTSERKIVLVDLTEEILEGAERICGGVMEVVVETWSGPDESITRVASGAGSVRVIPFGPGDAIVAVRGEGPFQNEVENVMQERVSRSVRTGEEEIFLEYLGGEETLLICGAGHIAQPLSRLGKMLEYRVVILDDRPAFASQERFDSADEVIAEPFGDALERMELGTDTSAVLVTRGHRQDAFCLRKLLDSDAHYIGMLGSRRRVRAVHQSLLEDGFSPEQLERVWSPIGVELGARSPAEIAVSIMAELISLRRGRLGGHLKAGVP